MSWLPVGVDHAHGRDLLKAFDRRQQQLRVAWPHVCQGYAGVLLYQKRAAIHLRRMWRG